MAGVLVTGGAGYIGSQVARELVRAGHEVVIYDNFSTGHRLAVNGCEVWEGDVCDAGRVEAALRRTAVEAVVHLAAATHVGESVARPDVYYRRNLGGGIALVQAMLAAKVRYLIFSSSAAVYGEPRQVPISEDHPTEPTSPYGESKLFFEKLLQRCDHAYGLRSISLRYFNAAGADPETGLGEDHEPETHLIPIILQTVLGQREHVEVFGTDYPTPDGTPVRDYVHVADLAAAHVLVLGALLDGAPSSAYNLGSERGYSVREVAAVVERVTGRRVPLVEGPRRPGDPAVLVADSCKIRAELGWRPRYASLEAIVKSAWRWHSRYPNGYGGKRGS